MKPHIKMQSGLYRLYFGDMCYASAETPAKAYNYWYFMCYLNDKREISPQAGLHAGGAAVSTEKQSPSKDRLAFILAAIAVTGLWALALALWVLAHHLN